MTSYRRNGRRTVRAGNVAIELALLLPVLVALATAVIDYGWYLSQASRVMGVTRDAARLGVTYAPDDLPAPDVVAVQHARTALEEAGIVCDASCDVEASVGIAGGVPSLTVSVAAPFEPLTGLVPVPVDMRAELTMALELRDPVPSS